MSFPRVVLPFRGFCGGLTTAVLIGLLGCLSMVPKASAAGPDGTYKLVKATGSLNIGGEVMTLEQDMIKNLIGASKGKLVVSQSQIKLDRGAALIMMKELGDSFGFQVEASISGPKALTLKKSGTAYVGQTAQPVVVNLTVNTGSDEITGRIRSHFKVKVVGNTMVLYVPVTGELLGRNLKGQVKATLKR